jgi:hypothetical protein
MAPYAVPSFASSRQSVRDRALGTGVTIDAARFPKVGRRVGYRGVLGRQIGLGRIR